MNSHLISCSNVASFHCFLEITNKILSVTVTRQSGHHGITEGGGRVEWEKKIWQRLCGEHITEKVVKTRQITGYVLIMVTSDFVSVSLDPLHLVNEAE